MVDQDLDEFEFATRAIHSGHKAEIWPSHPVVTGISLSSTFKQKEPGVTYGYEYSRSGNPTRSALENALAALEYAKYGLAFSSGLAATNTICSILKAGDEVICMDDVYGGTNRYFNKCLVNFGVSIKQVDCRNRDHLKQAISPATKLVWIETPTNPLLRVIDIKGSVELVKSVKKDIVVVVDNTFMTPYFQNPLKLGADIVMHSITKYINGHADVVMGCLMTNCQQLYERIKFFQNSLGSVPGPFDCFLVLRGLKTLPVRMEQHQKNAFKVVEFLQSHEKIGSVIYPGLPSHPEHELCKSQTSGFSGMVSFRLNVTSKQCVQFMKNLKIFSIAESLGGYESLIELPSIMTHASVPAEQRKVLGIDDTLVRISVGLEDAKDLIKDLQQALENI